MRVLVTGAAGFIGRQLTKVLLERGTLAGPDGAPSAITELILVDRAPFDGPRSEPVQVASFAGDLCDDGFLARVMGDGVDSLFHLAATLTIDAETDPDSGWAVNLHLPLRMLEACRQLKPGTRFVYASSIAVFGGDLPDRVSDSQVQTPQTSYGTAKSVTELLINDYSRHGFVDGRALRLPIVLVRPGAPTQAVSDRLASLVREPLSGRPAVSPVSGFTRFPVASVQRIARNLVRLHDAPASAFGSSRAVNQPGLTVSVDEMIAALGRVAGPAAAGCVTVDPVPAIQAVVDGWPREFVTAMDLDPPLQPDPDFDTIVRQYLADHRPG